MGILLLPATQLNQRGRGNRLWLWIFSVLALLLLMLSATSCGEGHAERAPAPPPTPVSVVTAQPQNVDIFSEYAAQTFARDEVEIRGQVDGYIRERRFQTGADVRKGQVLFVLDRRPYEADVAKAKGDLAQSLANSEFAKRQVSLLQAQADLEQSKASLLKAQQDVDRLTPLVKEDAAAQQDLDNARAALKAAHASVTAHEANVEQTRLSTKAQIGTTAAQVEANTALLETAQLNLEYATITAPVAGRVGDALIQVGGLVTKNSTSPLTTLVPLDPIWVRFKVSESDYLASLKHQGAGNFRQSPLDLVLSDGSVYAYKGQVQSTVNQVDQKTGTLEVQATFPNPQHTLLPGQFGRVRLRSEKRANVLVIPQRAVQELQGTQAVFTVGPDSKVQVRSIVTAEHTGTNWVVEQGLKPGDRVIVDGLMTLRPGAPVSPHPYKDGDAESATGQTQN